MTRARAKPSRWREQVSEGLGWGRTLPGSQDGTGERHLLQLLTQNQNGRFRTVHCHVSLLPPPPDQEPLQGRWVTVLRSPPET